MTIQNNVAYRTYDDRSNTISTNTSIPTYESLHTTRDSDTRAAIASRNVAVRSQVPGSPVLSTFSHDYEIFHNRPVWSTHTQVHVD